jgi:hypothetical protein
VKEARGDADRRFIVLNKGIKRVDLPEERIHAG